MKYLRKKVKKVKREKGAALILAIIFMSMFSALALAMTQMSTMNVQVAQNYKEANRALESAQSGLEVIRYHMDEAPMEDLEDVKELFFDKLGATLDSTGVYIPERTLDSQNSKSFSVRLDWFDSDSIYADITGKYKDVTRTIRVRFDITDTGNSVFDFGVATKGPLDMSGQAEIDGTNDLNLEIEASVYIEGMDSLSGDSFAITNNAEVAGYVSIADPDASYSVGSKAMIGGVQGDENVTVGVDYVDFPTPDPDYFRPYATGDIIDSSSNIDNYATLNNCIVAAGTNPTFSSNVTINGILFVEQPNKVQFAGKVNVNGLIVCDGDLGYTDPNNNMTFSGQVESSDASSLEGYEFDAIKQETGTFICAPGFGLDFSGQANYVNGAIAGSGINFSGQAGGTINGSIINYSSDTMGLGGQSELVFNRSGRDEDPAGFTSVQVLKFDPSSYVEL